MCTYTNPRMNHPTKKRVGIRHDGGGGLSAEPPMNPLKSQKGGSSADTRKRVFLLDTTNRDGGQAADLDLLASDKRTIAAWLDALGVDYLECGWPGANPTDDAFFAAPPALSRARLTAFGMTHKPETTPETDKALQTVLASPAGAVSLVGKTWDRHVTEALGTTLERNLEMIASSVRAAKERGKEVLFDAEHFFDGYRANAPYALACLGAALEGGADWLVLCETNGGQMPHEVEKAVATVRQAFPEAKLGIHAHNDRGLAEATSLAAVRAGCTMLQGTLGGVGERCGNANLLTCLVNLAEAGYETGVSKEKMEGLYALSRAFFDLVGLEANERAPFVGDNAFAHKGGLHASAAAKNPELYEHLAPARVGNRRTVLISDQAGLSNLRCKLEEMGLDVDPHDPRLPELLKIVKKRKQEGYSYERASASFAVETLRALGRLEDYFKVVSFGVSSRGCFEEDGSLTSMLSHADVTLRTQGKNVTCAAEGFGPVHALDKAMRAALNGAYPELNDVHLVDYTVRILNPREATDAVTRVRVQTLDAATGESWTTVGVSSNILGASFKALLDAYIYRLAMKRQEAVIAQALCA